MYEDRKYRQNYGDEVLRALGTLEGKMDIILEKLPEHENRLRSLERSRNIIKGVAALAGLLVAPLLLRFGQLTETIKSVIPPKL